MKRIQKENDSQKAECGRTKLGAQRSRSTHEIAAEKKEEDTRERDNMITILNSNGSHISTPLRKSG